MVGGGLVEKLVHHWK